MYYLSSKDRRRRSQIGRRELKLLSYKFLLRSEALPQFDKQKLTLFLFTSSLKKVLRFSVIGRNRCLLTSRAGSIFKYFRISRIAIKRLASRGYLPGLRKASW